MTSAYAPSEVRPEHGARQILRHVEQALSDHDQLSLDMWKADGYWVLEATWHGHWDMRSTYVSSAKDLTLGQWVGEFKALLDDIHERYQQGS